MNNILDQKQATHSGVKLKSGKTQSERLIREVGKPILISALLGFWVVYIAAMEHKLLDEVVPAAIIVVCLLIFKTQQADTTTKQNNH